MQSQRVRLSKKKNKSKQAVPYIVFQTTMLQINESVTRLRLGVRDSLFELISCAELFKETNNQFELYLDWPTQNGNIKLRITSRMADENNNANEHMLEFYCGDNKFLTITCDEDSLLIEKNLTFNVRYMLSEQDIAGIISNFNLVLRCDTQTCIDKNSTKKRTTAEYTYDRDQFAQLIQHYQNYDISYRIQNVLIRNAKKHGDEFELYIDWYKSQTHYLKLNFSCKDLFYAPDENNAGYSWVLTEETLLSRFREYQSYQIKSGQYFYHFTVYEMYGESRSFTKKTEILNGWLSSDGFFGELHYVSKGMGTSGNEVLDINQYLDQLFRVKRTFICDVSALGEDHQEPKIPLRLISALATGKTWYQNRLPGVKLFDCNNFATAANGVITQNSFQREIALRELQQFPLQKWLSILSYDKQQELLSLYQHYFTNPNRRYTRSQSSHIDSQTTIEDLTIKIYNASKLAKTKTVDLTALTKLLTDDMLSEDKQPDKAAADYWVKSRVHILLSGSLFWIKEREEMAPSQQFQPMTLR